MRLSWEIMDEGAEFMLRETGVRFYPEAMAGDDWLCCTAYNEANQVVGVLACEFKNTFDVHFSCAIADRRLLSERLLRTIFRTLFSRARRITALIDPENEMAEVQARRMGFVYEGFLRRGFDGQRDALLFGMLPEDCKYLTPPDVATVRSTEREGPPDGLSTQAS